MMYTCGKYILSYVCEFNRGSMVHQWLINEIYSLQQYILYQLASDYFLSD